MDESDSDAEPSKGRGGGGGGGGGADDEKYPVDGKFRSESEKVEIMAMPELEREQILADRANEIERLRQNRLLRQMVSDTQNDERKARKRSADSADLDDDDEQERRSKAPSASRRTGGTAMDALRRARADRQKRKEDHERRRDAYSPRRDSEDAVSEDEYRRGSRTPEKKKDEKKDEPKPELRDYERVRLGRNEFAQVCFTPGFEPSITGCFIRIALGPHPETGVEQYRMAIIKGMYFMPFFALGAPLLTTIGFTTGRAYALSGPNGTFVTDQYVKAAHGKAIKEFPFIAASSGKFSEVKTCKCYLAIDRVAD